jgi:CRP-like cAMP-binding protein
MDETHLQAIPLFASLTRPERESLARCADEIDIPAGRHLVNEGSFPYEFFVIEDGQAEVVRGGRHIADLGPGDFFGEMALLDQTLRSASVIAKGPLKAIVMTGRGFRNMSREHPALADKIRDACKERTEQLAG